MLRRCTMFKFKGSAIKKIREKKGLTKQKVIDDLLIKYNFKISRPTYNSLENGGTPPRGDLISILSEYFGVTPETFFTNN